MAHILIGLNGKYNIFSTISDAPLYEEAFDEEELREVYRSEYGNASYLFDFEDRFGRCKAKGTSSRIDYDLKSTICCNRAGEDEAELSYDEFVGKYLL
jgi:hypothetical protein